MPCYRFYADANQAEFVAVLERLDVRYAVLPEVFSVEVENERPEIAEAARDLGADLVQEELP